MKSSSSVDLLHRIVTVVIACAWLSACTTTQGLGPANPTRIISAVRPGDIVHCTLRNGSEVEFEVTSPEPTLLRGKSQAVAIADIAQIEIKRFSVAKTALLVGVVGAVILVAIVANGTGINVPVMGVGK